MVKLLKYATMPQLLESREIRMAQDIYGKGSPADVPELKELLAKNRFKYLGDGCECIVGERQPDSSLAIAFNFYEFRPKEGQRIILTSRVLHTLFPHNFPAFYAVYFGSAEKKSPGKTIRQKVDVVRSKYKGGDLYHKLVKYPFDLAKEKIETLNIPVYFGDKNDRNYVVDPYGNEYFLDVPDMRKGWKKEKIMNFMQESGYSKIDRRVVSKSIDRLIKLES